MSKGPARSCFSVAAFSAQPGQRGPAPEVRPDPDKRVAPPPDSDERLVAAQASELSHADTAGAAGAADGGGDSDDHESWCSVEDDDDADDIVPARPAPPPLPLAAPLAARPAPPPLPVAAARPGLAPSPGGAAAAAAAALHGRMRVGREGSFSSVEDDDGDEVLEAASSQPAPTSPAAVLAPSGCLFPSPAPDAAPQQPGVAAERRLGEPLWAAASEAARGEESGASWWAAAAAGQERAATEAEERWATESQDLLRRTAANMRTLDLALLRGAGAGAGLPPSEASQLPQRGSGAETCRTGSTGQDGPGSLSSRDSDAQRSGQPTRWGSGWEGRGAAAAAMGGSGDKMQDFKQLMSQAKCLQYCVHMSFSLASIWPFGLLQRPPKAI